MNRIKDNKKNERMVNMAEFKVPVEWAVCDFVKVEANSFEEAVGYVVRNRNEIPLGTGPEYIDGSYKINSEDELLTSEDDSNYVKELTKLLTSYGYGKEC